MRTSHAAIAEQIVSVNGVRLWTQRQGDGLPIVLLHGGPGLWDYFDDLASMVDDVVDVHRYDQRGGGRSEQTPPYDVATFVADLDALRVEWGHERWVVVGHSWGASLGLAYAARHPSRVEALICIASTGIDDDWQGEYHREAAARMTPEERVRHEELRAVVKSGGQLSSDEKSEFCVLSWQSDYADRGRAREFAARLLRPYGPNYDVNATLGADWSRLIADQAFVERVRRIDAPALVVHGADDPRPLRPAARLASLLPHARLEVVPDCGHVPWVEQPQRTREILRLFLERYRP